MATETLPERSAVATPGLRIPDIGEPRHWQRVLPGSLARHPYLPYGLGAAAFVVVLGAGLRFLAHSSLWLDEALSVDIAKLSVPDLMRWLSHDGSPPLYYLLLHFWIRLFGPSNFAVRSLSGLCSLASLPLVYVHARRLAGHRAALAALVLLAANPFAIRYATETRMYSLVLLLVLVGGFALRRGMEHPGPRTALAFGAVATLLIYTHYYALYLLAALLVGLVWRYQRSGRPAELHWAFAAFLVPFAAFLPWLPTFVYQLRHTGTPWAPHASPGWLFGTLMDWAGSGSWGTLLGVVLLGLLVLGVAGRPVDPRRVELNLRGNPPGRLLGWLLFGPLLVAMLASALGHGAYADRYTMIAFPAFVLLCAVGIARFGDPRVYAGVLAVAAVAGLAETFTAVTFAQRTQAREVAYVLRTEAQAGDVVAYCPDQLAPAVHRLLPAALGLREVSYADDSGPALVDWVDYRQHIENSNPATFADVVDYLAGKQHTVWLVRSDGYLGLGDRCDEVSSELTAKRGDPTRNVMTRNRTFEKMSLLQFPVPGVPAQPVAPVPGLAPETP